MEFRLKAEFHATLHHIIKKPLVKRGFFAGY
jgi:hypothetical protein